jgi:hypothetical protein
VTDEQEASLRLLLDDLCASKDTEAFAMRWGTSNRSDIRPGGLRVTCSASSPLASLELRPWDRGRIGSVDVEVRPDDQPLSWPSVRDRFGPFDKLPRVGSLEHWYAAKWCGVSDRAAVLLMVSVESDVVDEISLRRDPR